MTQPTKLSAYPTGSTRARSAPSISDADASAFGDPARDLAALVRADVPIARGWVLQLGGAAWRDELLSLVESALVAGASRAHMSIWYATNEARARFFHRMPELADVLTPREAKQAVDALRDALADVGDRALSDIAVRVTPLSAGLFGFAASSDPQSGDPDVVAVHTKGASPWHVDRRTMRLAREGGAPLDEDLASRAADLADRVQLVLGRPVEIELMLEAGRTSVASVRRLDVLPRFTAENYRRVRFLPTEDGSIAPLAIDAMAKALRANDAPFDETRMRRVYARPYRRVELHAPTRVSTSRTAPLAFALQRGVQILSDVASPVAAAIRYEEVVRARVSEFERVNLQRLDAASLVAHIGACQQPTIDGLTLLDRARHATLATLPALEALVGTLPRETFASLATPRPTRARRRVHEKMYAFAVTVKREIGSTDGPGGLPPALRTEWDALRRSLYDVRPLGLDVTPEAYGANDATFARALQAVLSEPMDTEESTRKLAENELLALTRKQSFGAARVPAMRSLMLVLGRLADAKGRVSEGIASALLCLRRAACQAGERLVDQGILEAAEDALYMDLAEIEQALTGEPGAYAARVRLRREDDARWIRYEAPIRLHAV